MSKHLKLLRYVPVAFYLGIPLQMAFFQWVDGYHTYPPIAMLCYYMFGMCAGLSIVALKKGSF